MAGRANGAVVKTKLLRRLVAVMDWAQPRVLRLSQWLSDEALRLDPDWPYETPSVQLCNEFVAGDVDRPAGFRRCLRPKGHDDTGHWG